MYSSYKSETMVTKFYFFPSQKPVFGYNVGSCAFQEGVSLI